jgi:anaerobic selenocysteine-containing dehydrogenase
MWKNNSLINLHLLTGKISTPGNSPLSAVPPSTTKAWRTPGSLTTSATLELATFPAKTGHFTNTAYSIPGCFTSMP